MTHMEHLFAAESPDFAAAPRSARVFKAAARLPAPHAPAPDFPRTMASARAKSSGVLTLKKGRAARWPLRMREPEPRGEAADFAQVLSARASRKALAIVTAITRPNDDHGRRARDGDLGAGRASRLMQPCDEVVGRERRVHRRLTTWAISGRFRAE